MDSYLKQPDRKILYSINVKIAAVPNFRSLDVQTDNSLGPGSGGGDQCQAASLTNPVHFPKGLFRILKMLQNGKHSHIIETIALERQGRAESLPVDFIDANTLLTL